MSKRIIFIDRDSARREEFSNFLSGEDFDVTGFESGKDALRHLLFRPVSAVVLEYGSSYEPGNPVPAGRRIVREITDMDAFVPLVLLCDRCEALEHDTSGPADIVLRHPITPRQLSDALKLLLGETLRERAQRKSGYIFAFR